MPEQRWSMAKRIRHAADGLAVAADINAEVAVNTGGSQQSGGHSQVTVASTSQDAPIRQHRGRNVTNHGEGTPSEAQSEEQPDT